MINKKSNLLQYKEKKVMISTHNVEHHAIKQIIIIFEKRSQNKYFLKCSTKHYFEAIF